VDVPQTSRRIVSEWLHSNIAETPNSETPSAAAVSVQLPAQPKEVRVATTRVETQDGKVRERDAMARLRLETYNRRGQDRYACRLGAEVFKAGSQVRNYCHLSDLSPGGCFLEMPLVFPQGSAVEITVRTHELKLRLSGQVKASHPGYGMGISFTLNTPEEKSGVQQLIDFVAATASNHE